MPAEMHDALSSALYGLPKQNAVAMLKVAAPQARQYLGDVLYGLKG